MILVFLLIVALIWVVESFLMVTGFAMIHSVIPAVPAVSLGQAFVLSTALLIMSLPKIVIAIMDDL